MPRPYSICFFLLFCTSAFSQNAQVKDRFDQLYIGENFDSSNSYWSTVSNLENLLIVQEGEYIMQRKSTVSPYAVMAAFPAELGAFRLITSLKLDKTSAPDGSIGFIFMAQHDGKGGFIFEINREQKFRLRQITNNNYRYLTGSSQEGGWIKHEMLKGLNLPNLIELRVADKKYDLFINNTIALTFEELAYKSGNVGFIIGPGSKGKADFIYIFTRSGTETLETDVAETEPTTPETDVIALAESIISLKTQINKLEEENEDQKGIIESLKSSQKEQEATQTNYDKYIKELELQLKAASVSFDSVVKVNNDLMKYKEMVKGNDDGDLVINLSRNLKNEKTANEALRSANKSMADSLKLLKTQMKDLKKNTDGTANRQKETPQTPEDSPKGEFVLPKEN